MESNSTTRNVSTGLRTHDCGILRLSDQGKTVTLTGWVQQSRDMNHFVFVDVRDRYGITQCIFNNEEKGDNTMYTTAQKLGREFVIQVTGVVKERISKNKKRATGDIEIIATELKVVTESETPPFLIEDKTDANEDTRMKFRYLDIRRNPVKEALLLRHRVAQAVRRYLSDLDFCEIETPVLIKSTPEGARDFVVPSRMNPGQFYALPQSPQTFKQILMVAGMDRYFQIVRCFRDEELRADRQPEFTQIDCEMSFVNEDDILNTFEDMMRSIFKEVVGHEFPKFERMTYETAMREYGIDKPDLRYGMKLKELTQLAQGKNFKVFDDAEIVVAISCPGMASWSTKKVKNLEKMCKSTLIGAKFLVWVKVLNLEKKEFTSSCSKFFNADDLAAWAKACDSKDGDLICVFAGDTFKTREAMGKFRHEMGTQLGFRNSGFAAHWVVDFPLLEYDEEAKRYNAMHHPFTSPHPDDIKLLETDPGKARAIAYDMVINGTEVGGGSIRIHQEDVQYQMFKLLGFTQQAAKEQFGFLLGAFKYGAPPHGGLAFGLDRLCTLLGGGDSTTSIRNYIAFPKNNMGRDMMIDSPSVITAEQLAELSIDTTAKAKATEQAATTNTATAAPVKKKSARQLKKEARLKAKEAAEAKAQEVKAN